MRIGVTGAFGFLGSNFVAELLERGGHEITAFSSRTTANPVFDSGRVRVERLDIMDRAALARAFSSLDAVAHFAGKVDFLARAKRAVWEADAIGALRVFDAALDARLGRLLYVSSINVLGLSAPGGLADESGSPYGDGRHPTSFASSGQALEALDASLAGDWRFLERSRVAYFDAKLAAWELAKRYAAERGLPVVTVFPGTAVGSGDVHRAITALVDGVWEGRLGMAFEGATSFVAARDFARGAVLALVKGRSGEAYVISGRDEHNYSYPEFMALVSRVARENGGRGIGAPTVLPRSLALAAASVAERLAPRLGLAAALVRSGTLRNVCSSAKARAELGYEPGPDLGPAILACRRFGQRDLRN